MRFRGLQDGRLKDVPYVERAPRGVYDGALAINDQYTRKELIEHR
jgi:hypothetical protein